MGINSVTEQPWYFGLKELNAAAHKDIHSCQLIESEPSNSSVISHFNLENDLTHND